MLLFCSGSTNEKWNNILNLFYVSQPVRVGVQLWGPSVAVINRREETRLWCCASSWSARLSQQRTGSHVGTLDWRKMRLLNKQQTGKLLHTSQNDILIIWLLERWSRRDFDENIEATHFAVCGATAQCLFVYFVISKCAALFSCVFANRIYINSSVKKSWSSPHLKFSPLFESLLKFFFGHLLLPFSEGCVCFLC